MRLPRWAPRKVRMGVNGHGLRVGLAEIGKLTSCPLPKAPEPDRYRLIGFGGCPPLPGEARRPLGDEGGPQPPPATSRARAHGSGSPATAGPLDQVAVEFPSEEVHLWLAPCDESTSDQSTSEWSALATPAERARADGLPNRHRRQQLITRGFVRWVSLATPTLPRKRGGSCPARMASRRSTPRPGSRHSASACPTPTGW